MTRTQGLWEAPRPQPEPRPEHGRLSLHRQLNGPSRHGDTHGVTHGVASRAALLLLLLDVLAFYWYSRKLFTGSGNGSEGIRWSRCLPRALLTATRHRLSKALGTPGPPWEERGTETQVSPSPGATAGPPARCPAGSRFCRGKSRPGKEGLVTCSSTRRGMKPS